MSLSKSGLKSIAGAEASLGTMSSMDAKQSMGSYGSGSAMMSGAAISATATRRSGPSRHHDDSQQKVSEKVSEKVPDKVQQKVSSSSGGHAGAGWRATLIRWWFGRQPRNRALLDLVLEEQNRELLRQMPLVLSTLMVITAMVAAAFLTRADYWLVALWVTPLEVIAGVNLIGVLQMRQKGLWRKATGRLVSYSSVVAGLCGVIWGCSAFLLYVPGATEYNYFLILVTGGLMAGATAALAILPATVFGFMIPAIIPYVLVSAASGDSLSVILALMMTIFLSAMMITVRVSHGRFIELMTIRRTLGDTERNLRHAVESSPDGLALFDETGQLVIKNNRYDELNDCKDAPVTLGSRLAQLGDGRWVRSVISRTGHGGTVALVSDITDLKEREAELASARDRALAASRAKSTFLATMSHEIRTPLTGVLGTIDLVRDTKLDADQRDLLDTTKTAAASLLTVINDILDFSRLEAGRSALSPAPGSIDDLVRGVAQTLKPAAVAKDLLLTVDIDMGGRDWRLADHARMRQILMNLAGNALKFTHEGYVIIRARTDHSGDGVTLEVSDTGIGIPKEAQGRLFQRFTQLESGTNRSFEGTGLGLSIVKRIVDLMEGEVSVRSVMGRGSTFTIHVPMADCSPVIPPATKAAASTSTRNSALDTPPGVRGGPQATSDDQSRLDANVSERILIAEDNPINQLLIERVIKADNRQIDVVENGVDALAALNSSKAEPYQVILMDIHMPRMDGVQATKAIRAGDAGDAYRDTPIIAVTANALPGQREEFLACGLSDYISKPIDHDRLLASIRRAMALGSHSAVAAEIQDEND